MRYLISALAVLLAACATGPADPALTSIHVVYHPERMEYFIENGGRARVIGYDDERVFEFDASREDFARVAQLLTPLEADGLTCSAPPEHSSPGHIVFRRGEVERRVAMHTACYSDGSRPLARNTNQAWRLMGEMGAERYVAPAIPDPVIITLQNMYWGNPTATWRIPRGGEGSYVDPERRVTFAVSVETFDRIRETFRPYEGTYFECNRVVADGPYGFIIWSSHEGQVDQRTRWDAGCLTGDAGDLFARLDAAMEILVPLRDGGSPE